MDDSDSGALLSKMDRIESLLERIAEAVEKMAEAPQLRCSGCNSVGRNVIHDKRADGSMTISGCPVCGKTAPMETR